MTTLLLHGCAPTPLANYLKALGVFRILAAQRPDTNPRAHWQNNTFILTSTLDENALTDFFLNDYQPTPIVAPWNGGSGFFPKDNKKALNAILASTAPRFAPYRETILAAQQALDTLQLTDKPDADAKQSLLLRCRNTVSDTALAWLDAAFVLTDDGAKFPPLLGTGGNDGRLDFSNNFMQRLTEAFNTADGTPVANAAAFLRAALFDDPVRGLSDNPIGQFSPQGAGGANATTGFDSKSTVNIWDYILALEGALCFAAAASKRLESAAPGQLAYPFCVQASGTGYGSAATADEADARCEIWMPLWAHPATPAELQTLLTEGRAWVGKRPAKNGLDFALAALSLGVDRGITAFQRYAFLVRNGLAYFATPLQRVKVSRNARITDLIARCDKWLQEFLNKAKGEKTPASIRRAARRLENAIIAQTTAAQADSPNLAQEILIALGQCEAALVTSKKWREETRVPPVPPLQRAWMDEADDGSKPYADDDSSEYRLAAALASLELLIQDAPRYSIRSHFAPVKIGTRNKKWAAWNEKGKDAREKKGKGKEEKDEKRKIEAVAPNLPLTETLLAIMRRRLLLTNGKLSNFWPDYSAKSAQPDDIARFITGQTDDARLLDLLRGLALVELPDFLGRKSGDAGDTTDKTDEEDTDEDQDDEEEKDTATAKTIEQNDAEVPPALYAQLKLCFSRRGNFPDKQEVPVTPLIFNLAAAGDGTRASMQALRRLHASSIPVEHVPIAVSGTPAIRAAAALLFPLHKRAFKQIASIVAPDLFPKDKKKQLPHHQ